MHVRVSMGREEISASVESVESKAEFPEEGILLLHFVQILKMFTQGMDAAAAFVKPFVQTLVFLLVSLLEQSLLLPFNLHSLHFNLHSIPFNLHSLHFTPLLN